jgi:hypothetical protein
MQIRDYNGEGKWSKDAIIKRYSQLCTELEVQDPIHLRPIESVQGGVTWIYPVMDKVIEGIEQGDIACRQIGIEFIEDDQKCPFGKLLKSNAARALRRSHLTAEEQERTRKRLVFMLLAGNVPHEYKEYAKLLKKVGIDGYWDEIEKRVDRSNDYVMRWYKYLKGD